MAGTKLHLPLVLLAVAGSYMLMWARQPRLADATMLSVTMNLSAAGVESDTYPFITATLDFKQHTSRCERSYLDPAYPSSNYQLSAEEMSQVQLLLQQTNLVKLKSVYSVGNVADLPTSTTTIRTPSQTFTIKDYGLEGAYPLQRLYKLVYKFEY